MKLHQIPSQFSLRKQSVLVAMVSIPVFAAIHYAAYWFRYDGLLGDSEWAKLTATLGWVVLVKVIAFGWFQIYQGWSKYITFHDLVRLAQAVTASSSVLLLAKYLLMPSLSIPRSIFLVDWGATLVLFGGMRSIVRFIEEGNLRQLAAGQKTNVLIVGVNQTGEALLRNIRRCPQLAYNVVGFISENESHLGTQVGGVRVVGCLEETTKLAEVFDAEEVWITSGELPGRKIRELVSAGCNNNFQVKVLPSYEQLIQGDVNLKPREVSIEDLLRRDPVQLDLSGMHRWIDDKVVLVTGSAGSIGSEICRQLLQFSPSKLILVDRSENGQFFLERELRESANGCKLQVCMADINDHQRMAALFKRLRPDIVVHAAAYKHVPLMEQNVGEAAKNIAIATRNLADLANEHDVSSFVMVSTDKAVNPTSVMGCCKRVAELYVQAMNSFSNCRFVTVRFGNVLDSAGSVVPVFRQQIANGGPVTVTHEAMTRYFMTIPEASQLVLQAGAMGDGGEIFVLDMGDPVRIMDLASDMVRLSGLRPGDDIEIEIVGVRPGEKLYEELYSEGEHHLETKHPKIMVAESEKSDYLTINAAINHLGDLANGPEEPILKKIGQIVPQFQRPGKLKAA